jgi:hypothetical protein
MHRMNSRNQTIAIDLALTIGLFAVLGVAGAFVWRAVVTLPTFVAVTSGGRTGGEMDQVQLARIVGIDGWFFVIAAVAGLVAGAVVVLVRRHSDPLVLVVLLAIAGALAAWVMVHVGVWLGPAKPETVLPTVHAGAHVPLQLKPKAGSVEVVWPFAAVLGALVMLLLHSPRPREVDTREPDERQVG